MTHVRSRVNGLKITIPNDARGVVHRFAIAGGGNELVFEPIKKAAYNKSVKADDKPMAIGGGASEAEPAPEPKSEDRVELSLNLADDAPPKKSRRAKADQDNDVI